MQSTITTEQERAICEYVQNHSLPAGLGTEEAACSIAAINLSLTGRLTDTVPECMSEVVGKWVITTQDAMPNEIRNSREWKMLLPLAAGTGREHEKERLKLVLDWMWERLASIQHVADKGGYGTQWKTMLEKRTAAWAAGAAGAAEAALAAGAAEAAWAAGAAGAAEAARAAWAAGAAGAAEAAWAAEAAEAAGAAGAARAAGAAGAARASATKKFWKDADPAGLLRRLVEVSQPVREIECR